MHIVVSNRMKDECSNLQRIKQRLSNKNLENHNLYNYIESPSFGKGEKANINVSMVNNCFPFIVHYCLELEYKKCYEMRENTGSSKFDHFNWVLFQRNAVSEHTFDR